MGMLGRDADSVAHWEAVSGAYVDALDNEYHRHRVSVIWELIPQAVMTRGQQVFDFGCGDAVLFGPFLEAGVRISGIDISDEMIALGRKRLAIVGHDPNLIKVGGGTHSKPLPPPLSTPCSASTSWLI